MKCPHCSTSIGLFSKEMNELGTSRSCPHCRAGVKVGLIHTRFAMAFVPVAVVSVLLGISGPLAAGIAGGVAAAFGIGLKKT